jgi:hypothetical protein
MAGKLVVIPHFEPPSSEEEAAEIRRRVFDCIFDPAALERLTQDEQSDTMSIEFTPAERD